MSADGGTRGPVREGFEEALAEVDGGQRLVVAISGGLDSTVLLHLARFWGRGRAGGVVAAHFDHRMRPSSGQDAGWVAGLCRAWDVPLRLGRASEPIGSEDAARKARYDFLESVRGEADGALVLTAHHADDQAETVLFRLFRGAGTLGLGGIPTYRSPAILRPLLNVWRSELEEYARQVLLAWRDDPTNRDPSFARNALRNTILPDVERLVAPGARRSLVRLAAAASEEEAAWRSVLPGLMAPLEVMEVPGGVSIRRAAFLELHAAVRRRVLRELAGDLGVALDLGTTRRAVDFSEVGQSGRAIELKDSLCLGVDLDRLLLARPPAAADERPLVIDDAGPGEGTAVLDGSSLPVTWGTVGAARHPHSRGFDLEAIRFPLLVRSRRPGDRIRLRTGTKKVKKLLLEHRVPPSRRHGLPLLVDGSGEVLWIPGLVSAEGPDLSDGPRSLRIGIG